MEAQIIDLLRKASEFLTKEQLGDLTKTCFLCESFLDVKYVTLARIDVGYYSQHGNDVFLAKLLS